MIGVIANPSEYAVVREFFELFKTPWEFYRSDRRYEVLLCAGDGDFEENTANLVLVYAGQKRGFDAKEKIEVASQSHNTRMLSHKGTRIPIYGDNVTFDGETGVLIDEESRKPAVRLRRFGGRTVVRIGYDLFGEVRTLLTTGQPVANAGIPTLELHIALLRDLIIECGIPLVEIPPVPDGYRFIVCLTHDVDHPSIRRHMFDHTMFGFLYRAVLVSLFDAVRGHAPFASLLKNWAAAMKLPFVYLGLAKDFWGEFDRYTELEGGACSTFFVIAFEGCPGQKGSGLAPGYRASRYRATDVADQIKKLILEGCEIGLHGLDAWVNSSKGLEELEEIRRITGRQDIGVRMHWLYFDGQSPVTLERAVADYDSTIGYNETVGYLAGTTQAYKPLGATRLLELPLHVMDTALFFPSYLDLSIAEAHKRVSRIIDNAVQFGGSITVNWHDRSIAPERLWEQFYVDMVDELKSRGAWFATATQAVSWFRKRRSVVFENVSWESGKVPAKIAVAVGEELPDLQLRVHNKKQPRQGTVVSAVAAEGPHDLGQRQTIDTYIASSN